MHRPIRRPSLRPTLLAAAVSLAVVACGGGGSGGSSAGPVVFSGTAATGAPMVGATIRVTDARGTEVARSQPLGADGHYSVELAEGATAPFVVVAELPDGEAQVSTTDQAVTGTVNVTPVTSLIAARVASDGTPRGLEADFRGGNGQVPPTPAAIRDSTAEVITMLAPLAEALGDSTNPVSGRFAVDGTGHDQLLDSLAVTIVPTSDTASNIEVTLRTRRQEDQPLPAVVFSSADRTLPVVPPLNQNELIRSGTSARIERLVALLNACYRLPLAERVDAGLAPGPAQIQAGPCRSMFLGADPSTYLHGGSRVGSGAFGGIFSGAQVVYDRPVLEYVRSDNDDVVFSLRWTDAAGNTDTVVLFAREEGDELRLVGNGYAHPMSVRGIVHLMDHLREDSRELDHLTLGYNLSVTNLKVDGAPVYDRVVVVAPVGLEGGATRDEFVLRPYAGYTSLRMSGNWVPGETSQVVKVAGAFRSARTTEPLHPRQVNSSGAVWVAGTPWSDERIERTSHKAVWTFKYFLAGNSGATPDAVQHMTTISRVPSVREAQRFAVAQFDAATLETLRSLSMESAAKLFWFGARPYATGGWPAVPPQLTLAWSVPDGAVAPNRASLWGRATADYATPWAERTGFDAGPIVPSSTRQLRVDCPVNTISSMLCDAADPTRFSLKTMVTSFELWGKDSRQVEVARTLHTFVPSLRPVD